MSVDSEERSSPEAPTAGRAPSVQVALRLVAAIGIAVVVGLVLWWTVPLREPRQIDVVGYPSYNAFDYRRMFLDYRLFVWVVPLVAATAYWLLGRSSRLGGRSRAGGRAAVPLTDSPVPVQTVPRNSVVRPVAALPAAGVVAVAASSASQDPDTHLTATGVLVALVYVAVVVATVTVRGRRRKVDDAGSVDERWATVNAVAAAVAATVSLFWFTQHTVTVSKTGAVDEWPWLPLWYAVPATALALAWIARRRVVGRPVRETEQRVNRMLVGSVALLMMTATLPGSIGRIDQYDAMMSATGADLWLRGDFPWRDVVLIHGVFEDALRSAAGFGLFEHTKWGVDAASAALWIPLGWVGVYLLGGWAARSSWLGWFGVFGLVLLAASRFDLPMRWVAAAFVFVLLGEAIRRRQRRWTVLLTVALFVEAVLAPEASFQVLAIGAVVVLVDLWHRTPGDSRWRSLRLTRDFVLTGLVCTLVWSVYLALNDTFVGFVRYYLVFGPGHVATGARPFGDNATGEVVVLYLLAATLTAVTIGCLAWRLLARRPMSVRQWVILACALFAALYGEKGLGRADTPHLWQSVSMTMPLAGVLLATALDSVPLRLPRRAERSRPVPFPDRLAGVAGVVVVLVSSLLVAQHAWTAPARNKSVVTGSSTDLLGYTTKDAIAPETLEDLTTVVDALAGRDGSVFDFTNTPGYFYYLMQRDSPTTFYHVSMAVPEFSQHLVIDELRASRPAVVAFDSYGLGLTNWDLIANEVRHYALAQYLLDGWTPAARSHKALFLVRNDLVPHLPLPGALHEPIETTDLYSANRRCDWGLAANYLQSTPTGERATLPVGGPRRARWWEVSGWSFDDQAGQRVSKVLVTAGDTVVETLEATHPRLDLASVFKDDPEKASSSFEGWGTTPLRGRLAMYAVLSDGSAHPLSRHRRVFPSRLRLGSRTIATVATPAPGGVELKSRRAKVATVSIPASVDLTAFELATFRAAGKIGRTRLLLATSSSGSTDRDSGIAFETRPWTGETTRVRVGSCLQWHGYGGRQLQLVQSRGRPITEIQLSGVS